MDSRTRDQPPSADAIEFVRFCHHRRRVGWPELYDEMCAVASRGLFRGWGIDELSAEGIGFTLFEMPALAALVSRVVADEQERRQSNRAVAGEPGRTVAGHGREGRSAVRERQSEGAGEPAPVLRFAGATAGA